MWTIEKIKTKSERILSAGITPEDCKIVYSVYNFQKKEKRKENEGFGYDLYLLQKEDYCKEQVQILRMKCRLKIMKNILSILDCHQLFHELLKLVGPVITKEHVVRDPISPET